MKPSINLPREKLAELLQASGSKLTPEEYTASLPGTGAFRKYPSRACAAAWSKNIFIVVLVLSAISTLFDLGVENIIVTIGLGVVTYFETRVHRYFWTDNPAAPALGFQNQACFAAGILAYGLYHSFGPVPVPQEYQGMLDAGTIATLQTTVHAGYLVIGIVGGISQFGLAWYYRAARMDASAA
jgi:hypothetical protein